MLVAAISLDDFTKPLVLFGFAAQFMFMLRFVVQWLVSERRGRSQVPVAFWWLSLSGGLMLFIYATMREDVVIMTGQLLGVGIYIRNLMLIYRRRWRLRRRVSCRPVPLLDKAVPEDAPVSATDN